MIEGEGRGRAEEEEEEKKKRKKKPTIVSGVPVYVNLLNLVYVV